MSSAGEFIDDVVAITEAVFSPAIAGQGVQVSEGTAVLRRGVAVSALIALETFVRRRTVELLDRLSAWPSAFDDLPVRFRDAAILDSLNALQRYARMLKRQNEDYQAELVSELSKLAMTSGPVFGFTKHLVGDYTGNLSDDGLKGLLATFQIKDCWNTLRDLSADVGFGVPSVHEIVRDVVRRRHESAHVHGYVPSLTDLQQLPAHLLCIGLCFDVAMTISVERAINRPAEWSAGEVPWRNGLAIFTVVPSNRGFRLKRHDRHRALRIVSSLNDVASVMPARGEELLRVVVSQDESLRPIRWRFM